MSVVFKFFTRNCHYYIHLISAFNKRQTHNRGTYNFALFSKCLNALLSLNFGFQICRQKHFQFSAEQILEE